MASAEVTADKEHSEELQEKLYSFSQSKQFTDVKVRGGGVTIHCHKAVIGAGSLFLRGLFATGRNEVIIDEHIVRGSDGHILQDAVKFLYLGDRNIIKADNVLRLLAVAQYIIHTRLLNACRYFMCENLTLENCADYGSYAYRYRDATLLEQCAR